MVINIHKGGTKSKCENYRGITLLPTAYKLFANIIKNRLNEHLEVKMVDEQCAFRKGRSCTDAIFTVQQIIEKRKEHNGELSSGYFPGVGLLKADVSEHSV